MKLIGLSNIFSDAMESVQTSLSSVKACSPRYQNASDVDDLKVPESAELFVSLLLGITGNEGYFFSPTGIKPV